jgi:hypothetical protein
MERVKPQEALQHAINFESYEYLESYNPYLLDAVEVAVSRGMTPAEIGKSMRRMVGSDRLPIALRCEQAAAHVVAQQAK